MARMPRDRSQRVALQVYLATMAKAWEESLRAQEDADMARHASGRLGPWAAAELAETAALVERLRIAEERSRSLGVEESSVMCALYETHNILANVCDEKRTTKVRFGRFANGLPGPSWHRLMRLARLGYIVLVNVPGEDAYKVALTPDGHRRIVGEWRL